MNTDYKIIRRFKINETKMIIIRLKNGTHIMSEKEWGRVYKCLYPKKIKANKAKHKIA